MIKYDLNEINVCAQRLSAIVFDEINPVHQMKEQLSADTGSVKDSYITLLDDTLGVYSAFKTLNINTENFFNNLADYLREMDEDIARGMEG